MTARGKEIRHLLEVALRIGGSDDLAQLSPGLSRCARRESNPQPSDP
jgi:hypothetical protein